MGCYADAEPLYQRSLHLRETQLEADHPDTASSLNNLAGLYESMGRYAEAEPLYLRAIAILTNVLLENHPYIQGTWDNLRDLIQQAIQQGQTATLSPHPTTQALLRELAL